MTNDEIIELAKQAGFDDHEPGCLSGVSNLDQSLYVGEYPIGEIVIEFAELIQARAWQPIETAPKDGTEIDLLDSYGHRWTDKSYAYHHWLHGKPTKDKSWGIFPSDGPTPVITHWMPKPPPAAQKGSV